MDNNHWIELAKANIIKLPEGTHFEVKELFKLVDWNNLSSGERKSFGRFFATEVKERRIPAVAFAGKRADNHSEYVKL